MSKKMLYRLAGDPEPGVSKAVLDGRAVERKIFNRGEKPEGWVSAAALLAFMNDEGDAIIAGETPAQEAPETSEQTDPYGIAGLDDKEAKLKVDEYAAGLGIKLDRRKSLPVMIETLEKALADR